MNMIIFDCETTGLLLPSTAPLEKQPRIIELGVILVDAHGTVLEEKAWLMNPKMALPPVITKITGLTDDDLRDQPVFRDVVRAIAKRFARTTRGIAHNAQFDVGMLTNELAMCQYTTFPWPSTMTCTVQEYLHVLGYRMSLAKFYQHVLGKPLAQTHRALDDCRALLEILQHEHFFTGG